MVMVSKQFAVDAERGKATMQFGKLLQLIDELDIKLTVDLPDNVGPRVGADRTAALREAITGRLMHSTVNRLIVWPGASDHRSNSGPSKLGFTARFWKLSTSLKFRGPVAAQADLAHYRDIGQAEARHP